MKTLRVVICVVLIIGVLAMSFSVLAVDTTPSPTPGPDDYFYPEQLIQEMNEEVMSRYIWLTLRAWGINIRYNDMDGFYQEVEDQIITWVLEYLSELPSAYTISTWLAPWQAGYDYWGNFKLNASALEDIQDFADWLIDRFNIQNNTNNRIDLEYNMGTAILYRLPVSGYFITGNDEWQLVQVTSNVPVYAMFWINNADNGRIVGITAISEYINQIVTVNFRTLYSNGTVENYNVNLDNNNNSNTLKFKQNIRSYFYTSNTRPDFGSYTLNVINFRPGNTADWTSFLNQFNSITETSSDVSILTSTIVLPDDDLNYIDGDGVTIIGDEPQYGQITFPDSISVDNLPAIITQSKIPDIGNDVDNPGFSVPWQAINGLIQYVAAPAGAIMALVNEAPVEGVIMLYALIGGIIIFGMIRIMREH